MKNTRERTCENCDNRISSIKRGNICAKSWNPIPDVKYSFCNYWVPLTPDSKSSSVNPDYYRHEGAPETIDVIKAWTAELEGIEAVCTANIIKYISRWKSKNGAEDLRKLVWYAEKLIEEVEKED